jgi:hypothetical protein
MPTSSKDAGSGVTTGRWSQTPPKSGLAFSLTALVTAPSASNTVQKGGHSRISHERSERTGWAVGNTVCAPSSHELRVIGKPKSRDEQFEELGGPRRVEHLCVAVVQHRRGKFLGGIYEEVSYVIGGRPGPAVEFLPGQRAGAGRHPIFSTYAAHLVPREIREFGHKIARIAEQFRYAGRKGIP